AVKYIGVFVMTASVFPVYLLARMIVSRRVALVVATATGAVPALAYSSYIGQETLAYPYAALCFLLIAKALVTRRRGWIGAAIIGSLVAPAVRGELLVIPVTLALATTFMWWSSDSFRRRRRGWTRGDWLGIVVLAAGVIIVASGFLSHQSHEWYAVTTYWKDRIVNMGLWAAGSLTIGIAVVPLVAGLAMLVRAPGEQRSPELRAFRSTAVAGLVTFG